MNSIVDVKFQFVLLVDDNQVENMVHQQMMDAAGFSEKTTALTSGAETLEFLKKARVEELPEVIFLDILMPGMDGFAFLEEFEKLDPKVHAKCKIIMLSSSDSFRDLNRANKNRFVRKFLNKPLTSEMLAAINF